MIEREITYLAKELPSGLKDCPFKEIIDVYIPGSIDHPKLRLRKNGDIYELTKKEPINGDVSCQEEQTIILNEIEFNALNKLDGKRVAKHRYYYDYQGRRAEFDIFQEALAGLVVIDFEFDTEEEKNSFIMPDFCLADITTETFIAGGIICGKTYDNIQSDVDRYNYQKLYLP